MMCAIRSRVGSMDKRSRSTRIRGTRGNGYLPIAALMAVLLLWMLGAGTATAAAPGKCSVKNAETGRTVARLQQAVRAAGAGDRLVVRGTCTGGTLVNKDLAIVGVETRRTGRPSWMALATPGS
jgi:hypothetical protein